MPPLFSYLKAFIMKQQNQEMLSFLPTVTYIASWHWVHWVLLSTNQRSWLLTLVIF